MEEVLKSVDQIAMGDKSASSVMKGLRDSIFEIAAKIQSETKKEEIERLLKEVGSSPVSKVGSEEDNLKLLRKIYSDLVRIEELSKNVDQLAGEETQSVRFSVASGVSENKAELQKKIENFYGNLQQLEKRMRLNMEGEEDLVYSESYNSGLAGIESAFDSETINSEIQKKKIEHFIENVKRLETAMGQEYSFMESEVISNISYSRQSIMNSERLNTPDKQDNSSVSDMTAFAPNDLEKAFLKKKMDLLYTGVGDLIDLMKEADHNESVVISNIHNTTIQSSLKEAELSDIQDKSQAFDFKK